LGRTRGINSWDGSGVVAGDVSFGSTKSDDLACNFRIVIEGAHNHVSYFRVNAYGQNAKFCQMRGLQKGDYVVICGELMNRAGREEILTEIRCKSIVIISMERKNDGSQEEK